MAYIVGEGCINCKHTDCVSVCPVDCFYEGPNTLVINPDECIDCGLCEPECPEKAIYDESELPADQHHMIEINVIYGETWPNITEVKPSLPDAEKWSGVPNKIEHLTDWPEEKKQ